MISHHNRQVAHHEIDHIFQDLFPSHGMIARHDQIALSHKMLDAMIHSKIALSDAGTGIGKTYAYLVAGISFSRALSRESIPFQPILISTSSIALQTAVKEEYIPFLSSVLMEDKLIQTPIRSVIRKGKSHYVCDERLMRRLRQVDLERKNPLAAQALLSLRDHLDTDEAPHLSQYDQNRVCVPAVCDCRRDSCRYTTAFVLGNHENYDCTGTGYLRNAGKGGMGRESVGKPAISKGLSAVWAGIGAAAYHLS